MESALHHSRGVKTTGRGVSETPWPHFVPGPVRSKSASSTEHITARAGVAGLAQMTASSADDVAPPAPSVVGGVLNRNITTKNDKTTSLQVSRGHGQRSDIPKPPAQARGGGPSVARDGVLRSPASNQAPCRRCANPGAQDGPAEPNPCWVCPAHIPPSSGVFLSAGRPRASRQGSPPQPQRSRPGPLHRVVALQSPDWRSAASVRHKALRSPPKIAATTPHPYEYARCAQVGCRECRKHVHPGH